MSRPDNWKEYIYRQCVNCSYCECSGNAMFSMKCTRTGKYVSTNEHIGCGMFSDGKASKSIEPDEPTLVPTGKDWKLEDDHITVTVEIKKRPEVSKVVVSKKRPVDKTKKSNIKCEHCKHFCNWHEHRAPKDALYSGDCFGVDSPNWACCVNYCNRCKAFEWSEDL